VLEQAPTTRPAHFPAEGTTSFGWGGQNNADLQCTTPQAGTGAAAAGLSADAAEESEVASSSEASAVRLGVRRNAEAIESKAGTTLGNPEEHNHSRYISANVGSPDRQLRQSNDLKYLKYTI